MPFDEPGDRQDKTENGEREGQTPALHTTPSKEVNARHDGNEDCGDEQPMNPHEGSIVETAAEAKKELNPASMPAAEYQPTAHELSLARAYKERSNSGPKRLRIKTVGNSFETSTDHPDQAVGWLLFGEAMGTKTLLETERLVNDAINLSGSSGTKFDERSANYVLSMVKGIAPQDEVELMLATQMAAIHRATIAAARRLNFVDNLQQADSAERTLNKLARTFASQVEALKRYRSKGEQSVQVKHVHVHEGGQAIVGNVTGGGNPKKEDETP